MRHELCLDNRNEPKWRVTLNAANTSEAGVIVYAAMLVPDIGQHGNERAPWRPYDPTDSVEMIVHDFFIQERNEANLQHPGEVNPPGDLWRIVNLDQRIRPIQERYSGTDAGQRRYVEAVNRTVNNSRKNSRPVVVLLDPCNGVADGGGRDNRDLRMNSNSVRAIWENLQPGDVMVIFQWNDRAAQPLSRPLELLAESLDDPPVEIHDCGPFAMLEIIRQAAP